MHRRARSNNVGALPPKDQRHIAVVPSSVTSDKQVIIASANDYSSNGSIGSASFDSQVDTAELLAKRMPMQSDPNADSLPIDDLLIYKNTKMSVIILELFLCYMRPRSETRGHICLEAFQWLRFILLVALTVLVIYFFAADDYTGIWNSVTNVINITGPMVELGLSLITCYFHCYWSRTGNSMTC